MSAWSSLLDVGVLAVRRIRLNQRAALTLIDGAYEAALDPAQWHEYLQTVTGSVGGTAAAMMHHDLRQLGGVFESVGLDPDGLDLYNRHYSTMDPWAFSPKIAPLLASAGVVTDQQLIPRSVLRRNECYNDFMLRFDRTRMVSVALAPGPAFSGISILRRERDQEFGEAEVRFLSWLVPHLRRALRLHDCLRTAANERTALMDGLDAVPCAVVIVDRHTRVALTNRAGATLQIDRDGVGIRSGVLVVGSAAANRRLNELVATAADEQRIDLLAGGTMVIRRPRSPQPLHLLVAPVRSTGRFDVVHRRAAAIVFISDPSQDLLPSECLLQQYYGLTPAEAEVAAHIGAGRSLEEIANARGTTIGTIRWYTKQVLAKTGCSNRAQLVRQLTVGLPGLFPED
jgi:DNA-binding CsgD family transcriptional regulator